MPAPKGLREAGAAGLAGHVLLAELTPCERILDRAIAGAAAEIAFQRLRQVGALLLVERGGGHDHAGGAEAALEGLRVKEGLLHRMQTALAGARPSMVVTSRPSARKAGTRQECTGVPSSQTVQAPQSPASQPFLTPKTALVAHEGAQALPGPRLGGDGLAVDVQLMRFCLPQLRRESARRNNR